MTLSTNTNLKPQVHLQGSEELSNLSLRNTDLSANSEHASAEEMRSKIEKDIAFLEHRLVLLQAQKHQNPASIKTYENMLQRRKIILQKMASGA